MLAPFIRRHGIDNCLDFHQFILIHFKIFHLLVFAEPGNHIEQICERPHFPDLNHLIPEIFQRKLTFSQLLFKFGCFFFINYCLSFFNKGQDIPHPQNARCHSVRMKRLQLAQFFTHTDKFYGLAGNCLDRKCGAAAGISVCFGEDHPADIQGIVESFGNVQGILTGHGISHEQDVRRSHSIADAAEFVHEVFVNMQPSCRIQQKCVTAGFLSRGNRIPADFDRVCLVFGREHRHIQLSSQLFQLLDSRGAVNIRGNQIRLSAFFPQKNSEFACCGGLARTLQTHQHHGNGNRSAQG